MHSVNAAASAAEVRPLHDHYRATRTVFSLDLPGYGFSDRSDRPCTPRLMTDALHATCEQIRRRCGAGPIDALAASLACEFLARAAVEAPDRFRSLALVSPTGFSGRTPRRGPPGNTRALPWLHRALRGAGWSAALFRGLTRPGVIRHFLERTWGSKGIDEELWRYDVLTTRQPGAVHAPLHFLAASMQHVQRRHPHRLRDALDAGVDEPRRARRLHRPRRQGPRRGSPHWSFSVFPTGALPYFEVPGEFFAACDRFLARLPPPRADRAGVSRRRA